MAKFDQAAAAKLGATGENCGAVHGVPIDVFPKPSDGFWRQRIADAYQHKLASNKVDEAPEAIRDVLYQLNSATTLKALERLTGERPLIADPFFEGGGLHQIERGGFRAVLWRRTGAVGSRGAWVGPAPTDSARARRAINKKGGRSRPFLIVCAWRRDLRSPCRPCRRRRRPSASRGLPSSACRRSSLPW